MTGPKLMELPGGDVGLNVPAIVLWLADTDIDADAAGPARNDDEREMRDVARRIRRRARAAVAAEACRANPRDRETVILAAFDVARAERLLNGATAGAKPGDVVQIRPSGVAKILRSLFPGPETVS